jgi:diaminopimelate epimerase
VARIQATGCAPSFFFQIVIEESPTPNQHRCMQFHKYHALGNDYLVLHPLQLTRELEIQEVVKICHRNYGLGSDGILLGPLPSDRADFRLRILNPDGSEAEKSGNGLRIFCRCLFDQGLVRENQPFTVETLGGIVAARVEQSGAMVEVGMGHAEFIAHKIPAITETPDQEVINYPLSLGNDVYSVCCVSVGNPHCVIPLPSISEELARRIGPKVENHRAFPNRINMQLLQVLDRSNIQIEIWERGAGYTLASGTSSCAASVIAKKLGWCDGDITVHMPGGTLSIQIDEDFNLTMRGPVTAVGVFTMNTQVIDQVLPGEPS